MPGKPSYPFKPKSNAHLTPGQFWGIPLSDGRWACGRVLAVKTEDDAYFHGDSRTFFAALMDWSGDRPPTADALAGRPILTQGWAHVRAIQHNGQFVLGYRPLDLDGIRGLLAVSHRSGGTVMLYEGAAPLRPATRAEAASMPILGTWGIGVVSAVTEQVFVKGLPLPTTDPTVVDEEEGKPRYTDNRAGPEQQLVLHLRRPRMSASDKAAWEAAADAWVASLDRRLTSSGLGEVGGSGRDGTLTVAYCYGPSAEAMWEATRPALPSLTLGPRSTATLRLGGASDDHAQEVEHPLGNA